nr:M20 aminoacylase family protein [uncultured Clostridium sp.]
MEVEVFAKQLIEWRHYLHMHPESAFEEKLTVEFVVERLTEMGLEVHKNIGGTGVVASLKVGDGDKVIGLRADMDCINLKECGEVEYKSKNEGKMHACGHDGHVATLLGAAQLLSERKNFNGTVRFVFQPAEEPGKGAEAMIDDGLFESFPMDEIYGLHNTPFLPAGEIHTRPGGIMASEDNFTIRIKGKGCHASSPHMGIDPLVSAAEIILALQTIASRNASPLDQAVVSCTEFLTDGAHNAIPSNVEILGDTRSCTKEVQELIETRMKAICENICRMNGAECEFIYTHEFAPTVNWEECVSVAVKAAHNVVGAEKVNGNCTPWMASEDFGTFLGKIPGCFVFLGSGKHKNPSENIMVHNSLYDYNDYILVTGAEFFAELIRVGLPQ